MLPLSFLADFLVPHIPAVHILSPHRHLCPAVVRRSPPRLPVTRRTSATLWWGSAHSRAHVANAKMRRKGQQGKGKSPGPGPRTRTRTSMKTIPLFV
jgi:hypothetical protein